MLNGLVIDKDGNKRWYLNDRLHRTDGPAVERADNSKEWWVNGKRHRTDGPAVVWFNGAKAWVQNDKLHRLDGPAIERVNGFKDWYVAGKHLGHGDKGFWVLWDKLTDEQRNNLNLLMHLPNAIP